MRLMGLGTASILALLLFWTSPALADCIDGARKATVQEKLFHSRVLSLIEAAMPDAPEGWDVTATTDIREPETFCLGGDDLPMRLDYRIEYRRVEGMEEMEGGLIETASASMTPQESEQAQLEALHKEQEKLAGELEEAVRRQEFDRIQPIMEKMQAIGANMGTVYQAIDERMKQATEDKLLRDVRAVVLVWVNADRTELDSPERVAVPGTDLAFRVRDGGRRHSLDWQEGFTHVFLGGWQTAKKGDRLLLTPLEGAARTEARTVTITVQADRARAMDLLQAMDLQAIRGVLAK